MRKISTLILCVLAVATGYSQRYLSEVFTDVEVTSNVIYGRNATVLPIIASGGAITEASPQDLVMDVYTPAGDNETMRPVVLYFHTGNFLPYPNNGGVGGVKTDSAAVEICSRLARMGYVAISCDYRLGWNPLATTAEERRWWLINAAYRGVQDCRTAVRFLRKSVAESSNPYGIDETRIAVWGQGTGGYIAFAAATLNNYVQDIATLPKFVWQPSWSPTPIPMVITSVNGDLDGTSTGVNPQNGDTLCYPNHVGYSSAFNLCVNMGGAMGDISWLEDGTMPMISFHVPTDPFAPYGDGTVIVPTTGETVVDVSGSGTVQANALTYGNNEVFAAADDWAPGAVYTAAANSRNGGAYGLMPLPRPTATDSAPWEWWDTATVIEPNNSNNLGLTGYTANPEMLPVRARAIIDTIMGYTAPRMMCAFNLPGSPCEVAPVQFDECADAAPIQSLFGGPVNQANAAGPFDNTNNTAGTTVSGYECWTDMTSLLTAAPTLDNTVWFTFTGDGEHYTINTTDCAGTATMQEGDTQMAIYSGSCASLSPADCNEDIDFDADNYWAGVTDFATEAGVTYYIMVDGYHYYMLDGSDFGATGTFCLEVTRTIVSVEEQNEVKFSVYPNPTKGEFTIQSDSRINSYEIRNTVGQIVARGNVNGSTRFTVDAGLAAGVYMVGVNADNGKSTTRLVVE